jgi:hypothetical protein
MVQLLCGGPSRAFGRDFGRNGKSSFFLFIFVFVGLEFFAFFALIADGAVVVMGT